MMSPVYELGQVGVSLSLSVHSIYINTFAERSIRAGNNAPFVWINLRVELNIKLELFLSCGWMITNWP